ncbi:MAG: hypothetical protein GX988_02345 [Clostridiales bacterium]|nr:hypothetical protein [Clostridiales bacterium]
MLLYKENKADSADIKDEYALYLVLTQTGTRVSRLIKFYTRAPFNHVSVSNDERLANMFSFARQNAPKLFPAGFTKENVADGVFAMYSSVPCVIYKIPVTYEQYTRFNSLIEKFNNDKKLYKYNLLGFITMMFNIPIKPKHSFMCSQFVAYILQEAGIINFNKRLSLVKPDDFRHMDNLQLIYSGDIKEYGQLCV